MDDQQIPDEPLEWRPATVSWPQIPAEMVASLALGMEDDLIVAARHGYSMEAFRELEKQPHFQKLVAVKRAEFEKTGVTFRAKAGWMAEELLEKVYLMAAAPDASFSQAHEALKTMIKAAGLEPKDDKVANSAPTFSISIDLGASSVQLSNSQVISPEQLPEIIEMEPRK